MKLQEIVQAFFDFLMGYQYRKEEEIIRRLLLKVAKISVCINGTDSWCLLEAYRKILLGILQDEYAMLLNKRMKNRINLTAIFNNYIKKLEEVGNQKNGCCIANTEIEN